MRTLLRIIIGLVVLVILAVAALPFVANTDWGKSQISERVAAATGRDFAIDGTVSLSLLPPLSLVVEGVRLGNAEGAANDQMVTLAALTASVDALAMIGGEIVVNDEIISPANVTRTVVADTSDGDEIIAGNGNNLVFGDNGRITAAVTDKMRHSLAASLSRWVWWRPLNL